MYKKNPYLKEVLIIGVDPSADTGVLWQPFAVVDINGCAHQIAHSIPLIPEEVHGLGHPVLELGLARQPREQGKLEEERAGTGRARELVLLGAQQLPGQAVFEIDARGGQASGRIERGQQPIAQVLGQMKQLVLVPGEAVSVLLTFPPHVEQAHVAREQTAQHANIRLEHRHHNVLVEAHRFDHVPHGRLELVRPVEERQCVQAVD